MNESLSEDEMKVRFPKLAPTHQMIALTEGVYSKNGGRWWLLDAGKDAYAPPGTAT